MHQNNCAVQPAPRSHTPSQLKLSALNNTILDSMILTFDTP